MNKVNPYFFDVLFSPITGLADDDDAIVYYRDLNLHTEEQYRKVIRANFVNHFNSLEKEMKERVKMALSYYLSKEEYDFERLFERYLPPFDLPDNPYDFFVWIWEELFYKESYRISCLMDYEVVPDMYEPSRYSKRKKD